MAYSMEFRLVVAVAHEVCGSSIEVAEEHGCSESWVRRLMQVERETGSLAPRAPKLPDNNKLNANDLKRLAELVAERPDIQLKEMAAALGNKVSVPTLYRARVKMGLSRKKKSLHAAEQERADVKEARENWFGQFENVKADQLVFLDEFGAATNMTRTHALAPIGQRAVCRVPHGHWKNLSTIAAMTTRGMIAAASFDGATDTELFVKFVQEELTPQLTAGQIVILDNLPAHKSPTVAKLINAAGCRVLHLPPYSPDFNPIEMAISKMKRLLRSLAQRTVTSLMKAIDTALRSVTAADAIAFIQHCRYAATTG